MAVMVYVASASVPLAWLDRVGLVLCPFRLWTGLPCPGCGLTHAFLALGHGDVAAAMRFNALGLPLYLLGLVWIAHATLGHRGERTPGESRAIGWTAIVGVLLLLAYGVYRILVPSSRPY